ncbi:MAG: ABC transporter transmembrane domain-containing protein [Rubricoccaceae bacterium]|nr:ABC transporter transmembrane domain-containing protein [Rubricoccaceae bacterium]
MTDAPPPTPPPDEAEKPPLAETLKRILGFARPYRGRLALALALLLLWTGVNLVVPLGMKALLDSVFEDADGALLNRIALGLLGLFAFQSVVGAVGGYLLDWTGERVVADLRQRLYRHLHRLGLRFFSETRTGEISSRLTNDVGKVQSAVTDDLQQVLTLSLTLVGSVVLMLALNWRLSLVIFVTVPPVALAARYFGGIVRTLSRQLQDQLADATAVAEEAVGAVRVVKAFGREPYETARYDTTIEALFATARRRGLLTAVFWNAVAFVFFGALVVIFWYGGREVLAARLTAGDLVAFIFYALNIARTVAGASRLYANVNSAAGASERLFELLDTVPEVVDAPDARPLRRPIRGAVAFEGVTFGYEPDRPVLRDVTFEVEPGQTVALVGPSGAGKTTLLNLIPRFYDPDRGAVRLDGHDLRTRTVASVRDAISIVAQDIQLFGSSIAENIRYGRLDATDAEIEAAARAANIYEFIAALPEGFATPVGERGVKLSGGQRQRVAIARAILKDPAVLLLDEATSALDAESERAVQEALVRLMDTRTSFVIAHRLATVRHADRILVLDEGQVVEDGTHDGLTARGGLYARLAALQFDEDAFAAAAV